MAARAVPLDEVTAAGCGCGCGGKAAALGAMRRAGLPVPDGFALPHEVFAAVMGIAGELALDEIGHVLAAAEATEARIDPALDADVCARAAALGRLVVRSSMSIEDAPGGAGAGVFASQVDVAPADVWRAVRAVWASALGPLAVAYGRGRGASIQVGVVVQRFVPGARITVYTRPPGAPHGEDAWIDAGGATETIARDADDPRVALARRAEQAIAAVGGADVELISSAGGLAIVQARPIVHPSAPARRAPPDALFAFTCATPGVTWRWDAAHNPTPLSPAQAGLVERVDAAGAAPYRMRVVAGHLYATSAPPGAPAADAAALRAQVEDALSRARAVLDRGAPSLAGALAAYVDFYRIWAREAGPPIAATRRALAIELPADDPAWRPRATITARLAAGELDALGALAQAWDVAAPTAVEAPALLDDAMRAAAARAQPAPEPAIEPHRHPPVRPAGDWSRPSIDPRRALATAAAELAEADDLAFARAQAVVRRALLAEAARRAIDPPDDVFWLPLDEVADPDRAIDPVRARAAALAARAAATRASAWNMPLAVCDGRALPEVSAPLRGVGFGARAAGRAIVVLDLAQLAPFPPGAVLVVPTVTPALALYAQRAAAIVADHGGPLDHGFALARELGIPYVVAPGATRALLPGAAVVVDAAAGTVTVTAA